MRAILVAVAALSLAGCQSVLTNLQSCERHYNGTVSGGTITPAIMAGAAKIDCCPVNEVSNATHDGCIPAPAVTK